MLLVSAYTNEEHAHEEGSNLPTWQSSATFNDDRLSSFYPFSAEASTPDPRIAPSEPEGQVPQDISRVRSLRSAGLDQWVLYNFRHQPIRVIRAGELLKRRSADET